MRPVLVGDAVAMTAAEHWKGAARGVDNALCMVVSTGVGGGLVLGGAVHAGPSGNAGHIGHISVEQNGPDCPCGARGCVERFASGTAIAAHALEGGWSPPPGVAPTAAAVAAAARDGNPRRAPPSTARGVRWPPPSRPPRPSSNSTSSSSAAVSPRRETLFGPLRRHLADYAVLDFARGVPVVSAALELDAGLIGAAAAGSGAVAVRSGTGPAGPGVPGPLPAPHA